MFQKLDESSGNTVGYKVVGKLTEEHYASIGRELDELVDQTGKIRLLVDLQDFEGIDLGGIREDFRIGMRHRNDIEKLAVVGDRKWQEWMTRISDPLTSGEVRYFDTSEMDSAWAWVRNGGV